MSDHSAQQPSLRIFALWICLGLFLLRVIAQIEVVLLAPIWLPPMEDWYSGLLPYPLLLPIQIVLLMAMTVIVIHEMRQPRQAQAARTRWRRIARYLAVGYFAIMAGRLAIQLARGAGDVIEAGGIPIMFHWVLALFLLLLGRRDGGKLQRRVWLNRPVAEGDAAKPQLH